MKKNTWARWIVLEAIDGAELIFLCADNKDVKVAIETLVKEYHCDPEDIAVLPLASAIPFTFQKVESVSISL